MRVKKIFGSILAGVLIVSGVSMSANAADIAPKNFEHRDRVIELSLERASGSFNMTVPAKSILRADKSFPLEAGETVTIKATYSPFSASVDFGLVDSKGKFHYLTVNNGTFDKTIKVDTRGNYVFAVRNNSSNSVSVKGMVSSTATILTTDSTKVPAGYVKASAELYRGIALAAYSGPVANGALSTGITATTGGASGKGTYTAHGTTWYKGSDGEMKTLELESVDYYMAVRANGGVDLSTEEKQIHTNAAGETYGEALVVKYLNEDVDMISAIGKNGTEGYIKVSDLPQNIPDYVPHDHEIPVYASDGVTVIDSFFISSGYTDTVG